ncbi:MAG: hypothetical protein ACJ8FY_07580 [Gemmataceae bacterium]
MNNGMKVPDKKTTEVLLEALKQAALAPGETRLYKSGKLTALFAGRTGISGEAAALALKERLLEAIRTETKGKTIHEWVRLTPAGVRFIHDHESPIKALEELKDLIRAAEEGLPGWLTDMRRRLHTVENQLVEDANRFASQLQALQERVESGLERLQASQPRVPQTIAADYPWVTEALDYLDQRKASGSSFPCPLPELFTDVSGRHAELTLGAFQAGLRTLHFHKAVCLVPAPESATLAQPEFAILEGEDVLYYATR